MNILLLDLGQEMRGGQRQVLYLARRLHAADGFAPVIAAPAASPLLERAREEGIAVQPLPGRFEWDPFLLFSIRKLIVNKHIDVVHTHCARSASVGALLAMAGLLAGARLVHSRRVSYPLKGGFSRRKYLVADAVAAVSAEIGQTLVASGVPQDRVHVIHSGIDPGLYTRREGTQRGEGPVVLGMVGALSTQKGHAVFLDALAEVDRLARAFAWRAVIVGEGALAEELQARASGLGLGDRVEFTGYRESRDVLPGFDVLVVPSVDGEGSSGVIKEGWACGVPVITSDLPSNLELVEHEASGLAFPSQDATALAQAMLRVGGAKAARLRTTLRTGGDERLQRFTAEAMASAYMTLYGELV